MGAAAKVTSKGQITLPASVRSEFDIKPGDTVFFFRDLDNRPTFKVRRMTHGKLRPPVKWRGPPKTEAEVNEGIARAVREDFLRVDRASRDPGGNGVIAVDTNVLLRMFVDDNQWQAKAARALIDERDPGSDPILVTPVIFVEAEWALRSNFDFEKSEIIDVFDDILSETGFHVDDRDAVDAALEAWRTGRADFADYMIGALARDRGASTTLTFDKAAAKSGGTFTLLSHK